MISVYERLNCKQPLGILKTIVYLGNGSACYVAISMLLPRYLDQTKGVLQSNPRVSQS